MDSPESDPFDPTCLAQAMRDAGREPGRVELLRIGSNHVYADQQLQLVYRVCSDAGQADELAAANQRYVDLAKAGAPILPPTEISPLPLQSGLLVTIWPLGEGVEGGWGLLGGLLARLHGVAPISGLDRWSGFDRARRRFEIMEREEVPESIVAELAGRLDELEKDFPAWEDRHLVHGDAHTGNLVTVSGEPRLIDLDDIATGCPEIDLAPMRITYRRFERATGSWPEFVVDYGRGVDEDLVEAFAALRQLTMLSWLVTLWNSRPDSRDEAQHRIRTLDSEAKWGPF